MFDIEPFFMDGPGPFGEFDEFGPGPFAGPMGFEPPMYDREFGPDFE